VRPVATIFIERICEGSEIAVCPLTELPVSDGLMPVSKNGAGFQLLEGVCRASPNVSV